ncbi:DUF6994 family protein [Propionicicella superfundia]|uniref:DUF6994 family protein n=1 Tax=Propionicicella superfundia TaxID=348582 RepID=UPI00040BB6F2|nr:hypothetical protein [Propionicicella superfundia]
MTTARPGPGPGRATALIDTTFDFRIDTPPGRDPDAFSPTLRRYHRLLWSKPLPSGHVFDLDQSVPGRYLSHSSELGDFTLSSDSVIPTYTRWVRMQAIVGQLPESEREEFRSLGYTMGGMMIWPGVPAGGRRTINVERGFNARIADRMDLTLECIRRHYRGLDSPMASTLIAYAKFFSLFESFEGFIDFFLLGDLVDSSGAVRFFLPCDDFSTKATPGDIKSYRDYKRCTLAFVAARNSRIDEFSERSLMTVDVDGLGVSRGNPKLPRRGTPPS